MQPTNPPRLQLGEDRALLLTGATGFVGQPLLATLLRRHPDREIILPIRAADDGEARARAERSVFAGMDAGPTLTPVAADLSRPLWGLDRTTWDALASRVGEVIHCAGYARPGDFDKNVAGNLTATGHVVSFARSCQSWGEFRRITYVSSTLVGFGVDGVLTEDDQLPPEPPNDYAQTKLWSELLVGGSGLDSVIARLSFVIPDETGWALPGGFLTALRLLESTEEVPADPHAPFDTIPVSYAGEGIAALADSGRRGGIYHLAAAERALTTGAFVAMAADALGKRARAVLPPDQVMALLREQAPVLVARTTVANDRALAVLGDAGVARPPRLDSATLEQIARVAAETDYNAAGTSYAQARHRLG